MAKSKTKVTKSTRAAKVSEPAEVRTSQEEVEQTDSRSLLNKVVVVILVLLGLFLLFNLFWSGDNESANTAGGDDETSQVEESENSDENNESGSDAGNGEAQDGQASGTTVSETETQYSYTVGEGESYTTIARRAVASMDGNLSPAERVAAETKLVTDAGAEWLDAGQNLVLSKDTVRAAVDWAKGLSAEHKAAWQPYADLIAW